MTRARTADKAGELRLKEMAKIKDKLLLAGLTLTGIDRDYNLPKGTCGNTLQQANLAGERAIAAALKTRPHLLWFTRYHGDGSRKSPQPPENYTRPPSMRQRRTATMPGSRQEAA
ncbi:helix-turn-helix domain-containing protein [Ensifer sesbaniae]|uniref:helix-turn-helix domain-containing protein n=1 Tax=Ensifer sesbaniae TaxID=1214071 RepID=UPI002001325F|nr:helix-turn-helix domain-containing protein [Ensifer sesbaniae]